MLSPKREQPQSHASRMHIHTSVTSWLDDKYRSEELLNTLQDEAGGVLPVEDDDNNHLNNVTATTTTTTTTKSTPTVSREALREHSLTAEKTTKRTRLMALMVVLVGAAASALFLFLGITSANSQEHDMFERRASEMADDIADSWRDYETSALFVHQACRNWRQDNMTREDFEIVYHYLIAAGLEFYAVNWVPNVTHEERAALEAESRTNWETVDDMVVNYTGFIGQEPDPNNPPDGLVMAPRSEQPFYFPIQFAEPMNESGSLIYYDLFSAPWERSAIETAIETWKPALTGRFQLVQHTKEDGYSVIMYHPGARLPDKFQVQPRDLSSMVINLKSLLLRAARYQKDPLSVYLYDTTMSNNNSNSAETAPPPEFLSGVKVSVNGNNEKIVQIFPETPYATLQNSHLYYEDVIEIGGRTWAMVVVPVAGTYNPDLTFVILCAVLIFAASILLAIWMIHNMRRSMQLHTVISQAAAEAFIVSNLFPERMRYRMIQDATAHNIKHKNHKRHHYAETITKVDHHDTKDIFLNDGKGGTSNQLSEARLRSLLTSEGIFGSKPIAELHPYTTVMYADLCNFTAWASSREPEKVFTLLEVIFHSWDNLAKSRGVHKVETLGDCYVAAAGLPEPRDDHAVVMCRFANDCCQRLQKLLKALEKILGPETSDLACRFGIHSGQVISGVIRGDKSRFQLFGDTVDMAGAMESSGVRNKVQISQETADLLSAAGFAKWVIPREDLVPVKGKGHLQTYFLHIASQSRTSSVPEPETRRGLPANSMDGSCQDSKTERLIEWNVEVLSRLLRSIVARREALDKRALGVRFAMPLVSTKGRMVLDEVADIIKLPEFNAHIIRKQVDPDSIELDPVVVDQLIKLVREIASLYRNNPFHNFEHASHVTMSVVKMMGRIVDPKEIAVKKRKGVIDQRKLEAELHDHTFGITSDPLTQFAVAFSALIHDIDHQGVLNTTLVREESTLALKYRNKSVAEQNSVDLAWELLMRPEYDKLRNCIHCDEEESLRFRALVVNAVMATDILDKKLNEARSWRWNKAFTELDDWSGQQESELAKINRKATIVIEHIMQASDISHTMQHWHVYMKWNERLFTLQHWHIYRKWNEKLLEVGERDYTPEELEKIQYRPFPSRLFITNIQLEWNTVKIMQLKLIITRLICFVPHDIAPVSHLIPFSTKHSVLSMRACHHEKMLFIQRSDLPTM